MNIRANTIRRAAVVGSGTMGAAIAAHLANAGIPVLLLDIVADGAKDRNEIAKKGLDRALKSRPAAFMHPSRAKLIQVGNLEDDLGKLRDVDWVFEAILEKLDVKRAFWEKVEAVAGPHTILSSNSSGIPMHDQIEGRSAAFKKRFVGTHFFNPPRYLKLLEVIPTPDTDPDVIATVSEFGDKVLGKGVVVAKDVTGFIANRIGVWGMVHTMRDALELGLSPDVVDALLGPLIGRASSASFRTNDLSGLDIGLAVAKNLDVATDFDYTPPALLEKLVGMNRLGEKTGEGFFKRVKGDGGKSVILTLNYDTLEYEDRGKVRVPDEIRNLPTPVERIKALLKLENAHGELIRRNVYGLIWFSAMNIPACADTVQEIDNALKWGFNWEIGAFDLCDALGLENVVKGIQALKLEVPRIISDKLASGTKFYGIDQTVRDGVLVIKDLKRDSSKIVKSMPGASLVDIGDGVALLEWHSKANTLGEDAVRMTQYAMKAVPEHFVGLVVGNQGENFSAGANLAVLLMQAQDGDFDEIDMGIRQFQKMVTSFRFSPFPTVAAPFGLSLGGGCEIPLHCDHVQAHAETYIGLVEMGVGLIPAGGGTTEMLIRFTDTLLPGEDGFSAVRKAFEQIALAKTSTSALEARDLGYLRASDGITMNRDRLIADAKRKVLDLVPDYMQPQPREITVMGDAAFANLKIGIHGLVLSKQASEYDAELATHLAKILSGGTMNRATTVSEQYLRDLEREAFLTLAGKKKTQERIAHTLKTGKPLRN
jgi:3-hydroxyacyl-CoA dehydrogenase